MSIFSPHEEYQEMGIEFWPTPQDQIELIRQRQAQVARVLSFYRGNERDYQALKRESDILFAVHTALCRAADPCNNQLVPASG